MISKVWITKDKEHYCICMRTPYDNNFKHLPVVIETVFPKTGVKKNINDCFEGEKEFHTNIHLGRSDVMLLIDKLLESLEQ